ncbi:MAG: hypothetical protein IT210_13565 [Armatimonadetes bacterium]|nr:hypothetical protein [Armatimonadota bacterium]
MRCPKCHSDIESPAWRFCDRCGEPLSALGIECDTPLAFSGGGIETRPIPVANTGGGLLSVLVTTNRDWLQAAPQRFLLGPSQTQAVTVTAQFQGIAPGTGSGGKIVVSAGDPDAPPVVRTLDISVDSQPA